MSGRTCCSAFGSSLYIRYNTDANVVYYLKTSSSYKLTGEKSLEIDEIQQV